jgi:hypothetical protein
MCRRRYVEAPVVPERERERQNKRRETAQEKSPCHERPDEKF